MTPLTGRRTAGTIASLIGDLPPTSTGHLINVGGGIL